MNESTERLIAKNEALEQEVARLRRELRIDYAERVKKGAGITYKLGRLSLRIFIGRTVFNTARNAWLAWIEWRPGNTPPHEETADLFGAMMSRFARMGLLTLLVTLLPLIPIYFLFQQTKLMKQQTKTLGVQTERLTQQTELMELQANEMKRQNRFLSFEQTMRFQEMLTVPEKLTVNRVGLSQIHDLGKKEPDLVIPYLRPLLKDANAGVALGTFLILMRVDEAWRSHLQGANLSGADLRSIKQFGDVYMPSNMSFERWDLYDDNEIKLVKVNMSNTNLAEANFSNSLLDGLDFSNANLESCLMENARARQVNFTRANLMHGSFQSADLTGAVLASANLAYCDFSNADLSGANLANIKHWRKITNIKGARIEGTTPYSSFVLWARDHGAIIITP